MKYFKIALMASTIILYGICFIINWDESGSNLPIRFIISILFMLSLLLMSYFYRKSNLFIKTTTIIFGVVVISVIMALLLSEVNLVWKYFLLIPMSILFCFNPFIRTCQIFYNSLLMLTLPLFLYALTLIFYVYEKIKKTRK